ncbi:MAG: hypothetical protein ACI4V3_05225 [Faecousia sp.]
MSRPKYWWYGTVVRTIREYPRLVGLKRDKQAQAVVANYGTRTTLRSGKEVNVILPRSSAGTRTTEDVAMRTMSSREEADIDAVELTIERIRLEKDGENILRAVMLVDWEGASIEEAADILHADESSVKRWRRKFIYKAAKNMGYYPN